ncbi:MAG: hypothetical protein K9N35_03030 [Candidatus Marinimicrobia bacterium]|nr:hypothetical protein [Candidatus Neomarinimicrobiota bacterium]
MPVRNKSLVHSVLILFLIVGTFPVFGAKGQKLELLKADKITSVTENGITYRRLVGDVRLKRGNAYLSCDLAEFQVENDEARLTGQVKITTETSILTAQTARYYGEQEYMELLGNARFVDEPFVVTAQKLGYFIDQKKVLATDNPSLIDSGSTLTADTIYYYEEGQLGDARGEALMINSSDSLSVAGDHLLYYSGKDSLLSYGNAEFQKWSATDTSMRIESDSLSLEEGYFFAWHDVVLHSAEAVGTCGQAVYMQDDEVAIMRDNPRLRENEFILTGEVFNLHLKNGELSSIYVPRDPHFTQEKVLGDTSFTDWLDGKVMAVEFEDSQPRVVTLIEMATSFFNVIEEGEFKGSNNVSGDTLVILLSDSSISNIQVTGGSQGKFKPADKSTDVNFPINYQAELIQYSMETETTLLQTNASIQYGDMSMSAGQIGVYWRKNLLRARSLVDTVGAEDLPVLRQTGQEDFHGRVMVYDLQSERGTVVAGRTKLDDGNYFGEEVTRVNEDVFLMADGYYTTCSLDEQPHFYFYSKQMKLLTDKIIIAKPVVLYIADIPLLALPFAVFPQQKGRSSGFLLPSYDYRPNNGGRAIKDFGYYWAINDYSDFKLTGDFWDQREEFKLRSVLRYKKRYRIDGRIDASMASDRDTLGQPADWKWKLNFSHNQTINPSFTIRAEGNLSGDANFDRTYSSEQADRTNTKLHSGISINKSFESIKSSMSLGGTYDENLQVTRRVGEAPESAGIKLTGPTLAFPSFRFSRSSTPLITTTGNDSKWYNTFRWSYSNNFNNRTTTNYLSYVNPDTAASDSLLWDEEKDSNRKWTHNTSLSGNTQVLKVLKLVGSISYNEVWGFNYLDPELNSDGRVLLDSSGNLKTNEVEGFIRRGTYSTSASLNTKLYGIFPVHLGPLQSIRHTMTPSVSLKYTPDFSTEFWGYTKTLEDTSGGEHVFDRFVGSDLGATPQRDALSMSYSLNNVFDYKLFRKDVESKAQFFTWTLSGAYDFKADSLKASDISNNFKVNLGKSFSLSPRATFEIYERDSTGTRKINKYRSPRMTNASFSFGFHLNGKAPGGLRSDRLGPAMEDSTVLDSSALLLRDELLTTRRGSGNKSAWTANFNFSYSYSHLNPLEKVKQTFNLNTTLKFNLSENWGLTYNPRFDLIEQKLTSGSVGVTRDLHCWTLSMNWTPMGRWGGINLVIRPKAQQLQDLKLEHKSKRKY